MRKVQMVTDRELEILKILWVRGKASVREVQDDLNKSAGPVAYSTVQTLLNIMEDKKGLVRHVVEGRTFIYIPKKSSDRTIRELTKRFVDRVFDGAIDRMMVALLDTKPPSPAEFDRLRAMIDEAQRQSDGRPGRRRPTAGVMPRPVRRRTGPIRREPRDARIWSTDWASPCSTRRWRRRPSPGFVVLAMVQCRQPARRRGWARAGLVATLALLPIAGLNPVPRIDLCGPIRSLAGGTRRGRGRPGPSPAERTHPAGRPGPPRPAGRRRWVGRGLVVAYLAGLGRRPRAAGAGDLGVGLAGPPGLAPLGRRPGDLRLAAVGPAARPAEAPGLGPRGPAGPARLRPAGDPDPARARRPEAADRLRLEPAPRAGPRRGRRPPLRDGRQPGPGRSGSSCRRSGGSATRCGSTRNSSPTAGRSHQFGTSGHYASSLLDLASSRGPSADPGRRVGPDRRPAAGVASALFQRVLMLLKCPFAIEGRTPAWWRWLGGLDARRWPPWRRPA